MWDETPDIKPAWFKRTIIRPATEFEHDAVTHVQRVLNVPEITGEMDEGTISHIRGLQQLFNLRVTGYIDEPTAIQIERLRTRYAVQE
jgi:putative peptidoglycan binding protein